MALALWYAGVAWPDLARKDGFASLHLDRPGALAIWAEMSPGPFATWTLAFAGPKDLLPDLGAFGLPDAASGAAVALPAGASPLLTPYGGEPKASELAREALDKDGFEVVTLGTAAGSVAKRIHASSPVRTLAPEPPAFPVVGTGPHVRLASFHLSQLSAQRLLSAALEPRGLFFALAEGAIEGEAWTDGKTLVVEAKRVAK